MEKSRNLVLGCILSILVSGMIGMATLYLWPLFTMWFIYTDLFVLISVCILCMIILLSALIPSAPVAIINYFKIRKSYILAVVCSLFMGLPITIKQIMNWSLYTQPQSQNGWRVEGGSGWSAFICIVFPGIMFIVATFAQMAGIGDKPASSVSSSVKALSARNKPAAVEETSSLSKRSRKVALFLAAFPWTGFLGIDRFYLGYIGIGILKFLTAGGLLVLYVVDIVKIAKGTMRDKDGNRLS